MTTATILLDSVNEAGDRLVTFQVRAPRIILNQVAKHRAFSLSCRSSRAVPVARIIEEIESDPVIPRFGSQAKGMQAGPELGGEAAKAARRAWLDARDDAVDHAKFLARIGASKEVINRLLEPWAVFHAVITATDYANFFALRIHDASQWEVRELAVLMARAYRDSSPTLRSTPGDYHLPYVTPEDRVLHGLSDLIRLSAARCGRVSYRPHDATAPDPARDLARADLFEREGHWVPFEHQARPDPGKRSGNLSGWAQARQGLPLSVHKEFDLATLEVSA